jgi:MFS family permease
LIVLTPAIAGFYAFHLAGSWRWIYVVGAVVALYFNVFVLIAQLFLKVPALYALAPTGTEPPFAIAQGIVLVLFILAGIKAVRRFRPVAG